MSKTEENLTEAEIRERLTNIHDSIRNARANVRSAEEKASQAEEQAKQLRVDYDNALNNGDREGMDKALAAIATANKAASVDFAVYDELQATSKDLEERRQVLAKASRVLLEDAREKEKEAKRRSDTMYLLTSCIDESVHRIRELNSLANKGR